MDVHAYMAERIGLIDPAIEARFPADERLPGDLPEAMRHLLFPGGKRLRPILSMASAEAVGGAPELALPIAVAVELIHTYSLIHDDLPCMDDDDERRGRPTVHKAFDEATAVLAGDALLTEAFAVLSGGKWTAAESQARLVAVDCVSRAAGARGLVGGQIDDLAFEARKQTSRADAGNRGTEHEQLASIHARKTAALFRAAIVGGAALGGATQTEREVLDAFGRDVGMAFQIADDLLDADGDKAANILKVQGIEDAQAGAEALLDRALGRIEGWGERAEPLRELARFAVRRKR